MADLVQRHFRTNQQEASLYSAGFSPDDTMVFSASSRAIYVYATGEGKLLKKFQLDEPLKAGSVAISTDSKHILCGSDGPEAAVLDFHSGRIIHHFQTNTYARSVAWDRTNNTVVVAGGTSGFTQGEIGIWINRQLVHKYDGRQDRFALSRDGTQLAIAYGSTITLFALPSMQKLTEFSTPYLNSMGNLEFSEDGKYLLPCTESACSGGIKNTTALLDATTGKELVLFEHSSDLATAHLSSDAAFLLTTTDDKMGEIWDVAKAKVVRTIPRAGIAMIRSAISRDNQYVLTGLGTGEVHVWHTGLPTHFQQKASLGRPVLGDQPRDTVMPMRLSCPSCQARLRAKPEVFGKRVKCPKCGGAVNVPDQSTAKTKSPHKQQPLKPDGGAPPSVAALPRQVTWKIDTSAAAFNQGDKEGRIPVESRNAFAKLVPSGKLSKVDVDITGRIRCQGCGHWNAFTENFFGAMGSAGCGCSKCACHIALGLHDDDNQCIWIYARMVTVSSERYGLEMHVDNVSEHKDK